MADPKAIPGRTAGDDVSVAAALVIICRRFMARIFPNRV
jgi:hypothetical protein